MILRFNPTPPLSPWDSATSFITWSQPEGEPPNCPSQKHVLTVAPLGTKAVADLDHISECLREFGHQAIPSHEIFEVDLALATGILPCRVLLLNFFGTDLLTELIGYRRRPSKPGLPGADGELLDPSQACFPERESLVLLYQMADALRHVHGNDWIHGGVCLPNFVTLLQPLADPSKNCGLKLIGYSHAERIGAPNPQKVALPRDFVYAAPELLKGTDRFPNPLYTGICTQKSDVYGLGVCFAMLLLGSDVDVSKPTAFDSLSPVMADLLSRMLKQDPNERITIAELLRSPMWVGLEFPPDLPRILPPMAVDFT
jgi:serine/threonine protein kinase